MAGTEESQDPIGAADPRDPKDAGDAKEAEAKETAEAVENLEDDEELEDLGVPGEVQQDLEGGDQGHRPAAWWGSSQM